jgi:hypothetical protein
MVLRRESYTTRNAKGRGRGKFAECVGARTDGGCVLYAHMAKKMTEATYSYQVLFSEGYTWTAGGKLPGIGSARAPFLEIKYAWRG